MLSLCLTKDHDIKTYCGSGGIAPRILNLCTRWKWVVSFTHRPLYPLYPLDRRLSGPQSRFGRFWEEKNSQFLPRIEPRSSNPLPIHYTNRDTAATDLEISPNYCYWGTCLRINILILLRLWFHHLLSQRTQLCANIFSKNIRECTQKFPDWVDNEIYAHNNKHALRSNTEGYGGKTHYTDSQNDDSTAPSVRELYHLQFSLQAASPVTSGYTLVCYIRTYNLLKHMSETPLKWSKTNCNVHLHALTQLSSSTW
jgi:hypothetical protein